MQAVVAFILAVGALVTHSRLVAVAGDRAPGQANGNKIDLNGGYWYEVRA